MSVGRSEVAIKTLSWNWWYLRCVPGHSQGAWRGFSLAQNIQPRVEDTGSFVAISRQSSLGLLLSSDPRRDRQNGLPRSSPHAVPTHTYKATGERLPSEKLILREALGS